MMMTLLRFLVPLLVLSSCGAQELSLLVVTNAAAFHGDFSGKFGEELVVDVYLQNTGKEKVSVVTSPKRTFNLESLKTIYWYDLEGLGGRIVVPNPYILKPVVLPEGTIAKIDEFRIPITSIMKQLSRKHATLEVCYQIDKSVASWMPVWTGELKETAVIK
jgi:hypothetical protein